MKFVALVSGGKDSCFNILHCISNGHSLIALANLYPPSTHDSDELDSFMYQTVGYHAVELYGEALDVPLYRAPILGKSVAQGIDYSPTVNDESEDLFELLQIVKQSHPDIEAVSVGAILSTYQRTRVENVCQRLGLISLAFLWQRSQSELLDEIIASGIDARIIKTAGIGLNRNHLGKSLSEMRSELIKLNQLYGLHLCGEGGEYETLVFDAPIFKKRLVIDESNIIDHSSDDVSYLTLKVTLEDKLKDDIVSVSTPPLLEERFRNIFDEIVEFQSPKTAQTDILDENIRAQESFPPNQVVSSRSSIINNTSFISNISCPMETLELEVEAVFNMLIKKLGTYELKIDDVAFISLLVSDMSQFYLVNKIYGTFFSRPNPPARFCIQANIGPVDRIRLSAVAVADNGNWSQRSGLHVQSQSYWAPANIGPYSQAISMNGFSYLAGQIGLIPASMVLINDPIKQLVLSLQNIVRVLETTNTEPAYAVAYVSAQLLSQEISSLPQRVWDKYTSEITSAVRPGILVAGIPRLPRNAAFEWTILGIEKNYYINYLNDEDDENDSENENSKNEKPAFVWPQKYSETEYLNITRFGYRTILIISANSITELCDVINPLLIDGKYGRLISATIYSTEPINSSFITFNYEVIPVDWLVHCDKSVKLGGVLLVTL